MQLIRPTEITDAILVSSNVAETDYTAWSAVTTYAAEARVRVVAADVHLVFESIAGGNLNHNPQAADGSTYWLQVGPTNRWKMFDQAVQSQTENTNSVEVEFDIPGRLNSLALLNLSAATAQVIVTDAVEGVIYDETYSLVSSSGITDWYAYFFEPIDRVSDLILTDLPGAYTDPTLEVILAAAGETVACGACIPGMSRDLGGTQWGAQVGIQDYSVKTRNDFGDYTVFQRAFNRRASFQVWVEPGFVDALVTLLATYRATPLVWLGDSAYASTAVYGFYKDFQVEIAYPTKSLCTLEIEGLT